MKKLPKERRYKNVDKGIKQLKRIQSLYGLDQFLSYMYGLAAIIFLTIGLVMAGMTTYSFLVCSNTTDGIVQRMEARDLNDHGIVQLHTIEQTIQTILGNKETYPVITFEANHKTYMHKSSASLNLPADSKGKGYITQIRYEPMQPEHCFLQTELVTRAIKSFTICVISIILLMIARVFKKPGKMYLKVFAQMNKGV